MFSELLKNLTEDYDDSEEVLDCGKAVNFTYYDDLIGIAQRYNHPVVPEPEVIIYKYNRVVDTAFMID